MRGGLFLNAISLLSASCGAFGDGSDSVDRPHIRRTPNPAVTVAFATVRHFPWAQVSPYIAIQVLASVSASFILKEVFDPFMSGGVTVPTVSHGQAFALEFIVTFILMLVNMAVVTDTRAVGELAGIAVGGTVLLNNLVAGPATGASMTPVRTLGPAVAAGNYKGMRIYTVAPLLGALAGAATYTAMKLLDKPTNQV
ncbi:putative aquaporin NIP5-1 [Morus notabilis]|uniref:Putative aquaporin NIP5-1 n=1 Tax=Morus notabilis TaxID=981085 RepID=W9SMA4_9ROSA|nr:putative aquaporin NIP5-1 [Morus notabilis]